MDYSPARQLHDATPCLLLLLWGSVSRLLMEPQRPPRPSLKYRLDAFCCTPSPPTNRPPPPQKNATRRILADRSGLWWCCGSMRSLLTRGQSSKSRHGVASWSCLAGLKSIVGLSLSRGGYVSQIQTRSVCPYSAQCLTTLLPCSPALPCSINTLANLLYGLHA